MGKRPYANIWDWMERTGTTQMELATRSGIDFTMLSKILSRSRRCSLANALVLSELTGVPVEKLFRKAGVDINAHLARTG